MFKAQREARREARAARERLRERLQRAAELGNAELYWDEYRPGDGRRILIPDGTNWRDKVIESDTYAAAEEPEV